MSGDGLLYVQHDQTSPHGACTFYDARHGERCVALCRCGWATPECTSEGAAKDAWIAHRRASLPEGRHDTALPEKNEGERPVRAAGAPWRESVSYPYGANCSAEPRTIYAIVDDPRWRAFVLARDTSGNLVLRDDSDWEYTYDECDYGNLRGFVVFEGWSVTAPKNPVTSDEAEESNDPNYWPHDADYPSWLEGKWRPGTAKDAHACGLIESPVVPSSGASTNVSGDATPSDDEIAAEIARDPLVDTSLYPPRTIVVVYNAAVARLRSTRGGTGHG